MELTNDSFTITLPDYRFRRWRLTLDLETMNYDDFHCVFKFAQVGTEIAVGQVQDFAQMHKINLLIRLDCH